MDVPELFLPLDPEHPGPTEWIGGGLESPDSLADSFLLAADSLAEFWRRERREGRALPIALPLIQTYRHALELRLKAACRQVAQLVGLGIEVGIGRDTRPDDLDDALGSTHSLAKLVESLEGLLGGLSTDDRSRRLPDDVQATLRLLHDMDERGTSFRYATQRSQGQRGTWEAVRPDPVPVDLDSATERLAGAVRMLDWGLDGYLDAYSEFLMEVRGDYFSNLDTYGP